MINANHLVDAVPAAMFGMFALWAGGSTLHWFIRMSVTAGALLLVLLVPAYELVIEFGIQMSLVAAGLAIWQRRMKTHAASANENALRRGPQVSLQTVLLATVVVAVLTAVLANAPDLDQFAWMYLVGNGVVVAAITLFCAWLVLSSFPCSIRVVAGVAVGGLMALAMSLLEILRNLLYYWLFYPTSVSAYLQQQTAAGIIDRSVYLALVLALAMPLMCAWLYMMVQAHWFVGFSPPAQGPLTTRRTLAFRGVSLAMSTAIIAFPVYLLYRLLTPMPYPEWPLPNPNGYDELIAAGQMIHENGGSRLDNFWQLPIEQLRPEVAKHEEAFRRIRHALMLPCRFPLLKPADLDPREPDVLKLRYAVVALRSAVLARAHIANQEGTTESRLETNLQLLRLAHLELRSNGTDWDEVFAGLENEALIGFWNIHAKLPAQMCKDLANQLWTMEQNREPWEKRVERQRIFDQNSGWQAYLQQIQADWNGVDPYDSQKHNDLLRQVEMRMLVLGLAIRAYRIDNGVVPASLRDLVPEYLPTVPSDPFGSGLLQYQIDKDAYTLYSVGPDRVDDGGRQATIPADQWIGDFTLNQLFPPPRPAVPWAQDNDR